MFLSVFFFFLLWGCTAGSCSAYCLPKLTVFIHKGAPKAVVLSLCCCKGFRGFSFSYVLFGICPYRISSCSRWPIPPAWWDPSRWWPCLWVSWLFPQFGVICKVYETMSIVSSRSLMKTFSEAGPRTRAFILHLLWASMWSMWVNPQPLERNRPNSYGWLPTR